MGFFKGGIRDLRQQAAEWTKQNVLKPSDEDQKGRQSSRDHQSQPQPGSGLNASSTPSGKHHIHPDRLCFEVREVPYSLHPEFE